jgi:hypothetical protein
MITKDWLLKVYGEGAPVSSIIWVWIDDEKSVPNALDIQKHNLKPIINPNNIPVGSSPVWSSWDHLFKQKRTQTCDQMM